MQTFWEKDSTGKVFLLFGEKRIPVGSVVPHEDYVAVEEKLRRERPNPFDAIAGELDKFRDRPEIVEKIIAQAYADKRKGHEEQKLTREEVKNWIETWDGFAFIFKRVCERSKVPITDSELFEMSQVIPFEQLKEALDQASAETIKRYSKV